MEPALTTGSILCGEGACSRWSAKQTQIGNRILSVKMHQPICDRFAAEREQAPSPHLFWETFE
jgi:hypothetical protein